MRVNLYLAEFLAVERADASFSHRGPLRRDGIVRTYIHAGRDRSGKDFTAGMHTRVRTISADSIGPGDEGGLREEERMLSDNVPSADFRTRLPFSQPRPRRRYRCYEHSTRKPGLNARRGNFSAISRDRLRDLRYANRRVKILFPPPSGKLGGHVRENLNLQLSRNMTFQIPQRILVIAQK